VRRGPVIRVCGGYVCICTLSPAQVGDIMTAVVAPVTGYNSIDSNGNPACPFVAFDFMRVNSDSSLTEAYHSWGVVQTSGSNPVRLTSLIPQGLQATVSTTAAPYVLRARCGTAFGGPFNPVGNISTTFRLRSRNLAVSSITGTLGISGQSVTYNHGADIPLSLALSLIPNLNTYPLTVGLVRNGAPCAHL
jgi:hypothetical protein